MQKTRATVIDYIFPQLLDKSSPAERLQFYLTQVNWDELLALSPYLYQQLSKDALELQKQAMRR